MHQRHSHGGYNGYNNNNGYYNNNSNMNRNSRGGYNSYDAEGGRGGYSASDMNSNIMEQQNNDKIDQLSSQVAMLKGLTIDIGNEVKEQNSLLDQMGDGFANTGDLLAGSLRKIGTMLDKGGARHMCMMVGFIVAVIVLLYMLMKSGR
jgi:blocked-early-in-transport protein 1